MKITSERIREIFYEGYENGRRDAEYVREGGSGTYTKETALNYSNAGYLWRDMKGKEEQLKQMKASGNRGKI
jgi:hypothetical protein